jgi:uncharacterized protein (DUF433 family)
MPHRARLTAEEVPGATRTWAWRAVESSVRLPPFDLSAEVNPPVWSVPSVKIRALGSDTQEVRMSYPQNLAAALSGATPWQLSHWRNPKASKGPVLIPEVSAERPILYSFRDVVALRTFVKLRQGTSLQKIRRAVATLREDLGLRSHLSSYQLVGDGTSIYLVDPDQAVDLLRRGNVVIHEFVEVLRPFYVEGRWIPDLLQPRPNVEVDPAVRGGEPVIAGTRIPYSEVASLVRDGVARDTVGEFYPGVSAEAADDAFDFAQYVDSYSPRVA